MPLFRQPEGRTVPCQLDIRTISRCLSTSRSLDMKLEKGYTVLLSLYPWKHVMRFALDLWERRHTVVSQ